MWRTFRLRAWLWERLPLRTITVTGWDRNFYSNCDEYTFTTNVTNILLQQMWRIYFYNKCEEHTFTTNVAIILFITNVTNILLQQMWRTLYFYNKHICSTVIVLSNNIHFTKKSGNYSCNNCTYRVVHCDGIMDITMSYFNPDSFLMG